jgi:hypothetical protein
MQVLGGIEDREKKRAIGGVSPITRELDDLELLLLPVGLHVDKHSLVVPPDEENDFARLLRLN